MLEKPQESTFLNFSQIVKYYAVGGGVNAVGYLLFLWLVSSGVGHKLAATLLYLLGMLVSFWLNRKLVFDSDVPLQSGLVRLFFMMSVGYIINISMLFLFVDICGYKPGVVQLFSVVVVSIFFYLVNKIFVHRSSSQ